MRGCIFIFWEGLRRFVAIGDRCRWALRGEESIHAIIIKIDYVKSRQQDYPYINIISRELRNQSIRNFGDWGYGVWQAGAARLLPWTM